MGEVAFDEHVIDSIYARKLYVKNYPATATTMELKKIAELLTNGQPASCVSATGVMKTFENENYYQILQVPANARADEIKHAYRDALAIYEAESVATYSLFSDEQRERLLQAIETAFDTLINEEKRIVYNQMLIDTGQVDAAVFSRQGQRKLEAYCDTRTLSNEKRLGQWVQKKADTPEIRQLIEAILSKEMLSGLELKQLREAYGIDICRNLCRYQNQRRFSEKDRGQPV